MLTYPLRTASFFASPVGLMDVLPHWLSELRVLGPAPQVGVLKVGALGMWSKPLTPQGAAGCWGVVPNCLALCQGWGLWKEHVLACPDCFDMGIFSFA